MKISTMMFATHGHYNLRHDDNPRMLSPMSKPAGLCLLSLMKSTAEAKPMVSYVYYAKVPADVIHHENDSGDGNNIPSYQTI